MSIRNSILHALNTVFRLRGLELRPVVPVHADHSMPGALRRLRSMGLTFGTVIDVGAAEGNWSRQAMLHWPDARYLLMEPLAERRDLLAQFCNEFPSANFVSAAAGAQTGEVTFTISEDLDGSGIYDNPGARGRTVPVTTIDAEISKGALPGPYLLKLDTHGFEQPILEGAEHTLARTDALIVEAYNFKLTNDSFRFHELCAWLETRNFRCSDLVDPLRRQADGALWQMDLIFLRNDARVFSRQTYQ